MIFGVGAVIAMLSIGSGAERQALEMIDRLGVRNLLVRNPKLEHEELQEIRKKSVGVSLRDARAIVDAVPGVAVVAPRVEIRTYKCWPRAARPEPTCSASTTALDADAPPRSPMPLPRPARRGRPCAGGGRRTRAARRISSASPRRSGRVQDQ
jgi:hypothetical protein